MTPTGTDAGTGAGTGTLGPATVTVGGVGHATADPATMRADVAASAVRGTLVEALAASEAAAAAIRAVLARRGVTAADATTAGLTVHPEHEWRGEGQPALVRYRSEHRLQVRLRDLATAGEVLGEALAAAGDDVQLGGVGFEAGDEPGLRARAREAAWVDARSSAEQYAALAGRRLGAVLTVDEPGSEVPPGPRPMFASRQVAESAIAVEPGAVAVSTAVQVRWELI